MLLYSSFTQLWVLALGRVVLCFLLTGGQGLRLGDSPAPVSITDLRARTEVVPPSSSSICVAPLFSSGVQDLQIDRRWVPNQIRLCPPITPATIPEGSRFNRAIIPRCRSP